MRPIKFQNLSLDFEIRIMGRLFELKFIPCRWSRVAWREDQMFGEGDVTYHIYAGPFHLWSMGGTAGVLGVCLDVSQDPFHGGELMPSKGPWQRILRAIDYTADGWITAEELVRKKSVSRWTIGLHLSALEKAGLIIREPLELGTRYRRAI